MTSKAFSTKSLTRRSILSGGASLVGSVIQPKLSARPLFSESATFEGNSTGELYVFPGSSGDTTVVATTWPLRLLNSGPLDNDRSTVRIHIGSISRTVELARDFRPTMWSDGNWQICTGCVRSGPKENCERIAAVVIEAENGLLGEGTLSVWAERSERGVKRQRVGSPFLTGVAAHDGSWATLYHSTSPEQDRMLLSQEIAKRIAALARHAGHVSEPDEYGHRVASMLLPDVLHYNPKLPSGFSFAAQNGRHPGDDSAHVVATIIHGIPGTPRSTCHANVRHTFPYLQFVEANIC